MDNIKLLPTTDLESVERVTPVVPLVECGLGSILTRVFPDAGG